MARMLALCLAVVGAQSSIGVAAEPPAPKAQPRLENASLRPRPPPSVKPRFKQRRIGQAPGPDTPLVVSFSPSDAIALVRDAATFEFEPGIAFHSAWPKSPWLVRDLDGDGRIRSGRELFGTFTSDLREHGFAALARLDDNRDGTLDARDGAFGELQLWTDANANRAVDDGELRPLSAFGIDALPLDYLRRDQCDRDGNCVRQQAPISWRDALGTVHAGRLVDLHLVLTPRSGS